MNEREDVTGFSMEIPTREVTACLVTRGDQQEKIDEILEGLVFENVIVWDNSVEEDWKCAGRYLAALRAHTRWVYFQDDDVIVPEWTQLALLERAQIGACVANWGHGGNPDGYEDIPLVGGGAVVERWLPWEAIARWARHWPMDEAFAYEADFVVGALYDRFVHVELPFEIDLAIAQAPERLCNQEWQRDLKKAMTDRARAIRAMVPA